MCECLAFDHVAKVRRFKLDGTCTISKLESSSLLHPLILLNPNSLGENEDCNGDTLSKEDG